jgi:hypothetical protein
LFSAGIVLSPALMCVLSVGGAPIANAKPPAPPQAAEPAQNLTMESPPRSWAVAAVTNELIDLHHDGSYLRYRMHIVDAKGDQIRDIIESKDGAVARLVLRDGRALTDDEDRAERERLNTMIESPAAFAKHTKSEAPERKIADDLLRLMPDAMLYSYVPGQPQVQSPSSASQVVLDYKPNPGFSPPTTISESMSGLAGRVWIDVQSRQVVRMEGNIFQPVNFGWGMVAHIYPGGKLLLEQTNAGGQRWIYSHFVEQASVRALMVKTVNVHQNIAASDFQTLPSGITYQDAIHMLLNTPLPTH